MSSGYSLEYDNSRGWRGGRQGSRGHGEGDSFQDSRDVMNQTGENDCWKEEDTNYTSPSRSNRSARLSSGNSKEDDWEGSHTSRGRGFSGRNTSEDSNHPREDRMYGGGDHRGGASRGRGFSVRKSNDGFHDNSGGGQDEGRFRNDGGWRNRRGAPDSTTERQGDDNEWELGIEDLSIRDKGGDSSRGYGQQTRGEGNYHDRSRTNTGDGWENNDIEERRGYDGDRRTNRGRGFRGGGGGFRDSRNDDGESNRGRGGDRFNRREDGQSDGRRGRGGRGGGFSSRGNDEDGGNRGEGDERPREQYIPPAPATDEETVFGSTISTGNNFNKYDNIPIKVSGDNVPKPINTFQDCNFQELLLDNIRKSGYIKPTPVQKHAIPAIASGRDVMGCAQTGSGKTAAFLLPIIHILLKDKIDLIVCEWVEPQVVICSPTRELALQIFNEARKFAYGSILKVCVAYGGTATYHQASQIGRGCHILVATPGRLNDFVGRGRIKFSSCRFFVLDEADRMLDMGFLPAIEKMLDHETMTPIGQRQTLMFSATFPDDIQRLAANYLHEYLFLAVGIVGGACSDVEQNFYLVRMFEKKDKLKEILSEAKDRELTLVFVEKQRTADFIAAFLSENNFPTTSIHGARLQSQREEALADFKCGRMPTLVATAVAARGLDIKNVAHVVNFDMPSTVDEYVHRIGRTGRVGNRGKATSFYDPDIDGHLVRDLTRILQQTDQVIPSFFDGANDSPSTRGGGGFRRSQNFGGQDVRGGENNIYHSGPTVVLEEVEEAW